MADALTGEPDRVEELRATGLPVLVLHGEATTRGRPSCRRRWPDDWARSTP
jgi:hypothetical protein